MWQTGIISEADCLISMHGSLIWLHLSLSLMSTIASHSTSGNHAPHVCVYCGLIQHCTSTWMGITGLTFQLGFFVWLSKSQKCLWCRLASRTNFVIPASRERNVKRKNKTSSRTLPFQVCRSGLREKMPMAFLEPIKGCLHLWPHCVQVLGGRLLLCMYKKQYKAFWGSRGIWVWSDKLHPVMSCCS